MTRRNGIPVKIGSGTMHVESKCWYSCPVEWAVERAAADSMLSSIKRWISGKLGVIYNTQEDQYAHYSKSLV